MFQPAAFREDDLDAQLALVRAHPLGLLVSHGEQGLTADPLPFLADVEQGQIRLRAHLSRANAHWRRLQHAAECLVIFQGVEGYVSPGWYPSKGQTGKVVPTWNYLVVHARVRLQRFCTDDELLAVAEVVDEHTPDAGDLTVEQVLGDVRPISADVGLDGLDEWLEVMVPGALPDGAPAEAHPVVFHAVDADAVEELIGIGEGLQRGVPGQAQQVFFALDQAAGAIFFAFVRTRAAVVGIQATVAGGEHFIDVFFQDPGFAHPPARHLIDDRVGPQVFLYFGFDVIAVVDHGDLHIVLQIAQEAFRHVAQGLVEFAVGMAELFFSVDNQDIAHLSRLPSELRYGMLPAEKAETISLVTSVIVSQASKNAIRRTTVLTASQ